MKNITKSLIAPFLGMALILFSIGSRASENLEVAIIENTNTLLMEVKSPSSEEMNIFLLNRSDREIFRKQVGSGETLESQFNFSDLKNGTYTLVSQVANMKLNRVIQVTDSRAELVNSYYSFLPVFDQLDDKIRVHYINNGGEDIGISVEDDNGEIFKNFFGNEDFIFTKTFSLENLEAGDYKFKFTSNGDFYTYEFKLD